MSSAIDLARLPAPEVIAPLDFETIRRRIRDEADALRPGLGVLIDAEGTIAAKAVQAFASEVLRTRQRANDQAKGCLLAHAWDATLDNLGALLGVERLVVVPADPAANPPLPAVMEADDAFRRRIQLELEAFTTAATPGSLLAAILAADGRVRDAAIISPAPLEADIYVLGNDGDGTPPQDVLDAVSDALAPRREFGKLVRVHAAEIVPYAIEASIWLLPGPSAAPVMAAAQASAEAYAAEQHAFGRDITVSGLYAALHVPGVQRAEIVSPAPPIIIAESEAAFCTGVTLTEAGRDE